MKNTKRDDRHAGKLPRGVSWLGILLLGLLLWGGPASADPADNHHPNFSEEGEVIEPFPFATMTIAKKTEKRIINDIGDSYALSQATMIVGKDGRQVRLEQMLVPCEAKVTYNDVQGVRYAFRIQILDVGSYATSELILEVPR